MDHSGNLKEREMPVVQTMSMMDTDAALMNGSYSWGLTTEERLYTIVIKEPTILRECPYKGKW